MDSLCGQAGASNCKNQELNRRAWREGILNTGAPRRRRWQQQSSEIGSFSPGQLEKFYVNYPRDVKLIA